MPWSCSARWRTARPDGRCGAGWCRAGIGRAFCASKTLLKEEEETARTVDTPACACLISHYLFPRCPPPQEAEGLVGELGEVVRQQKLRMRGLVQEKAEACARLQAMNPQVRWALVGAVGAAAAA